jgi:hypothetical protein
MTSGLTVAPASGTETIFAEVLADIVGVERVSVDSHFFDDLGADSLVMAQFCARVRKRGDLPPVSMKDIYAQPTIRSLATSLADEEATSIESPAPVPTEVAAPAGTPQYILCGALQFLFVLGYWYGAALAITQGYEWISAGSGAIDVYLRSVLFKPRSERSIASSAPGFMGSRPPRRASAINLVGTRRTRSPRSIKNRSKDPETCRQSSSAQTRSPLSPRAQTNNAPKPRTPTWTVLSPSSSPLVEPTAAIVCERLCMSAPRTIMVSSTFDSIEWTSGGHGLLRARPRSYPSPRPTAGSRRP